MKTASNSSQNPVDASCPSCGGNSAEIVVTVSSGIWERQFLQCKACSQALITDWSNTHLRQPAAPVARRIACVSRGSLRRRYECSSAQTKGVFLLDWS